MNLLPKNIFIKLLIISGWLNYGKATKFLSDNYPESIVEDANLNTIQLITKYGYPSETHYVTTEDKYILGMHRIPRQNAKPVLLVHGLMDSSATWILTGPDCGLGYYLYDQGYDVWMGNARGNRYSRNHSTLNPDEDRQFWTYSWHEIGMYDLPAMIDYIVEKTDNLQLGYFGHSQGTTAFWVMASMRSEYIPKVAIMNAMAPVAFMKNIGSPLFNVARNFIKSSKDMYGEFMPHTNYLMDFCFRTQFSLTTCQQGGYQILGKDPNFMNMTYFPVALGHIPAGCNMKQIEHFIQLVDYDRFCQFDYGREENLKRYATEDPPNYPLENIKVPVALYYAANDYLSNVEDVKRLISILPNVVYDEVLPHPEWNHMSMVWGPESRKLVHEGLVQKMKEYL